MADRVKRWPRWKKVGLLLVALYMLLVLSGVVGALLQGAELEWTW